jgi:hypothetical protein
LLSICFSVIRGVSLSAVGSSATASTPDEERGAVSEKRISRRNRSKKQSYSRNRPCRPIGLRNVKDPAFSRQSVH